MMTLRVADLFCGAGGSSTGLMQVAASLGVRIDLTAVNHWPIAVETHAQNHPEARHICEDLQRVRPRQTVGGNLDLLWASPACTDHSHAKGDAPMSADDQSRASAWVVLQWVDETRPAWVIVENVPAFLEWGPRGRNGAKLRSRTGETFRAYVAALRSRGYTVEYRTLSSANYGAHTDRPRLFIVGRFDGGRSRGSLPWPAQTHAEASDQASLFGALPTWRGADAILDWAWPGRSIFDRQVPLATSTMVRIEDGLRRFGGAVPRLTTRPLPTIATSGAISLIRPFLINYYSSGSGLTARAVDRPLPTITTRDRFGLVRAEGGDITLRMLTDRELARGMGFEDGYAFAGNQTQRKAQIGNAVEVNQAAALWAYPVTDVAARRRVA